AGSAAGQRVRTAGTAKVFCAVEPKAGRHFTFPTPDRSGFEFAQVAVTLALAYPKAKTIHLVMDNLKKLSPQGAGGCLRRRNGRRSLESLHRPLHPHPRKLAQSGGNRNRSLLAAMPREPKNPRSADAPSREPGMESAHEPRPNPKFRSLNP